MQKVVKGVHSKGGKVCACNRGQRVSLRKVIKGVHAKDG